MNRSRAAAMIGMIGLLTCAQTVFAENISIKSKIAEINTTSNYFKAYYLFPQTEKTEEIKIDVTSSTIFQGVASLRDLKTEETVSVQANYDAFTHEWQALVITYDVPSPAEIGRSG